MKSLRQTKNCVIEYFDMVGKTPIFFWISMKKIAQELMGNRN
jgi:hypothetical protein